MLCLDHNKSRTAPFTLLIITIIIIIIFEKLLSPDDRSAFMNRADG